MTVLKNKGVVLLYSCVRHCHRDSTATAAQQLCKLAVKIIQELNFNPIPWVKNRT